jgi:hypothetical protein
VKDDENESENEDSEEETEVESGIDGEEKMEKSLWNEEEDKKYIEESQMKQMRRKGLKVLSRKPRSSE